MGACLSSLCGEIVCLPVNEVQVKNSQSSGKTRSTPNLPAQQNPGALAVFHITGSPHAATAVCYTYHRYTSDFSSPPHNTCVSTGAKPPAVHQRAQYRHCSLPYHLQPRLRCLWHRATLTKSHDGNLFRAFGLQSV